MAFVGDVRMDAHTHTQWVFLCCTLTLPHPQVNGKNVIVLEPHPHHTLQASFGKDTTETEEDILTCNVKCMDTVCYHLSGLGTIFRVFVVNIYVSYIYLLHDEAIHQSKQ